MHKTGNHVNLCERLLRRECFAKQAWKEVIFRFDGSPFEALAWNIIGNHRKSILAIRRRIASSGSRPFPVPDLRGALIVHLATAATLLGDRSLMGVLRLAETDSIHEYETLLDRFDRRDPFHATISRTLLPRVQNHVAVLDIMAA
jgi:hypothetical protein